jgi:hypothetical protein
MSAPEDTFTLRSAKDYWTKPARHKPEAPAKVPFLRWRLRLVSIGPVASINSEAYTRG